MQLSDEHFCGRTVIAADGQAIGEVGAVLIDTSTWTIVTLRIKLNKAVAEQIGVARNILRAAILELPVHLIQSVGDAVLLSVPVPDLRHILPADEGQEAKT